MIMDNNNLFLRMMKQDNNMDKIMSHNHNINSSHNLYHNNNNNNHNNNKILVFSHLQVKA